jgi:transposase
VAVEVYPGSTADPSTVADQVEKLRGRFALERVVLVGDRGVLTQARIEALRAHPGLGWISALRSPQIAELMESGPLQPSLFDEGQLAEIEAPEDFPGERLVACYNPFLADERRRRRQELLEATEQELTRIEREVARRTRTPLSAEAIALKVGRAIGRWKMAKHFTMQIDPGRLVWSRDEDSIRREAALDGIYVIRTSEPAERFGAADVVRQYKALAQVEQAFRTLKGMDLRVRPIFHRLEDHVRAHILLCFLAYYVEWHLRRAWAPLLFADEELEVDRWRRDPVAPAQASASARHKKATRRSEDGLEVQSFATLMAQLGTLCRHRCRLKGDPAGPSFELLTDPSPLQQRAFELLGVNCSQ